ncbi:MAG: DUF6268 family outer membrane beta-barrel protein [Planctomycetaceae bacterium]
MIIPCLVLLSAVAANSPDDQPSAFYRATAALQEALEGRSVDAPIVRGQSPFVGDPLYGPGTESNSVTLYPPTYEPGGVTTDPGTSTLTTPYQVTPPQYYSDPTTADPWLNPGTATVTPAPYGAVPYGAAPYAGANVPQGFYGYGMNGPQPYRYGLHERVNVSYLPPVGATNNSHLEMFEVDVEKSYVTPLMGNWVFTTSPQINYRSWSGPRGLPGPSNLPGSVYRFGLNLQLATPVVNGWSAEFGFNPAVATDFNAPVNGHAVLFDGYAVAFWTWSRQVTWALGALYWDRVDNIILPYAGVVYSPNDLWEFRLVFPQPRVSYFLGTPNGVATWIYAGAEYHVEAYYVDLNFGGVDTRVQYSDWRVYGGIRWEVGQFTSFAEAGAALARKVDYDKVGKDFDPDNGFFGRVGLRW